MFASILCGLKWTLSALSLPVAIVAGIFLVVYLLNYTDDYSRNRVFRMSPEKRDAKRIWDDKVSSVMDTLGNVFAVVVLGFLLVLVLGGSALIMMPKWGCDNCLPESMQTQCKTSEVNTIRLQDAATVQKLCGSMADGDYVRSPAD